MSCVETAAIHAHVSCLAAGATSLGEAHTKPTLASADPAERVGVEAKWRPPTGRLHAASLQRPLRPCVPSATTRGHGAGSSSSSLADRHLMLLLLSPAGIWMLSS